MMLSTPPERPEGSKPCRMSWDNVLCDFCRTMVDEHLVPIRDLEDYSNRSNAEKFDWHPSNAVENCASLGCRLCTFSFAAVSRSRRSTMLWQEPEYMDNAWLLKSRNLPWTGCIFDVSHGGNASVTWYCKIFDVISDLTSASFGFYDGIDWEIPHPRSSSTASEDTMVRIGSWLEQCKGHSTCEQWHEICGLEFKMPTRLLELIPPCHSLSDDHPPILRLVKGEDLPFDTTRYATLSHCWGSGVPLQLLQNRLATFSESIPWQELPKTFQEAVTVCLRLNISYLWIDALCIIQDSQADWETEASLMARVYGNSYVNLSALDSSDSSGGLFRERRSVFDGSCSVPTTRFDKTSSIVFYRDDWEKSVETAPLSLRAWVLQERFLAPRVVHFGKDQIHWECLALTTSEGLPLPVDRVSTRRSERRMLKKTAPSPRTVQQGAPMPDRELQGLWSRIVRFYSLGELSHPSDRPVAISGLARALCRFQRLQPGDYLAGLWRPVFVRTMMWVPSDIESEELSEQVRIPSWSWLSVGREIFFPRGAFPHWRALAELLQAHAEPVADPFGPVASAYAQLRAPLCEAFLKISPESTCLTVAGKVFRPGHWTERVYSLHLDHRTVELDQKLCAEPVYLLLALSEGRALCERKTDQNHVLDNVSGKAVAERGFYFGTYYECLIIVPAELHGQFRRIGLFTAGEHAAKSGNAERTRLFNTIDAQFRSHDVPEELYEHVDDEFLYTITLI